MVLVCTSSRKQVLYTPCRCTPKPHRNSISIVFSPTKIHKPAGVAPHTDSSPHARTGGGQWIGQPVCDHTSPTEDNIHSPLT
eukprot:750788-Hanusia_phi.AAC.2